MTKTEEIMFEYIREEYEIGDDPDYTKDINLFENGFVDSLDALNIINYIEERFEIEITQRDLTLYPMNSVEEIAAVIDRKLA